jgi:hypothetical protein
MRISGDQTHPLRTGILIEDSTIDVENTEISGAIDAAVRSDGNSQPRLSANFIHGNSGTGVLVGAHAGPLLTANRMSDNGAAITADSPQH